MKNKNVSFVSFIETKNLKQKMITASEKCHISAGNPRKKRKD
jgi:hypothetical protein